MADYIGVRRVVVEEPVNINRGASGSTAAAVDAAAGAGMAAAPAAAGSSDPCRDPSGVWSGLISVLFPFGADAARAIWMLSAAVSPSCGLVRFWSILNVFELRRLLQAWKTGFSRDDYARSSSSSPNPTRNQARALNACMYGKVMVHTVWYDGMLLWYLVSSLV